MTKKTEVLKPKSGGSAAGMIQVRNHPALRLPEFPERLLTAATSR
jgi:hypothetical protein